MLKREHFEGEVILQNEKKKIKAIIIKRYRNQRKIQKIHDNAKNEIT